MSEDTVTAFVVPTAREFRESVPHVDDLPLLLDAESEKAREANSEHSAAPHL